MTDGNTSERDASLDEEAVEVTVGESDVDAAAAASTDLPGSEQEQVLDGEFVDEGPEAAAPETPAQLTDAEKAQQFLALAQRTQADFENFRKRAARDAQIAQQRGVAKLAKELLPAIDNLERAIQAAEAADDPLIDGVRLVRTELLAALARVGIEPFSPAGEVFDPQHHEAVAQAPIEGATAGTVVEVYQQGFRHGEMVLRPARVLVAA